jgi:Protein of unknown function (DUF3352)
VRATGVLVVSTMVALLAACGGGGDAGGAADVVPADIAAFFSVDTNLDGDQWQAVDDLAAKFPGGEGAVERLLQSIEGEGGGKLDLERDVKPALGPELGVVVLDFDPASGEEPHVVALTQPEDNAAFKRLLEQGDEPVVTDEVDGWQIASDTEAALDAFRTAGADGRLSDADEFQRAMRGLDEQGLVKAYVDGDVLGSALAQSEGGLGSPESLYPGGKAPSIGFVLRAEDDGARLDGNVAYAGSVEGSPFAVEPYTAELPQRVPGDALAYLSFHDLASIISSYRDALAEASPEVESQIGMLESFLGVSLEEDIGPLLAGESAVYVRRGALIPEVTLVTEVEDEAKAVGTLDDVVAGLSRFGADLAAVQRTRVDGVDVHQVPISPPFVLSYGAFDGLLVVTTSADGIRALRESADRLAGDDAFAAALDRAGVPGETTGFGYVDLSEALPLLFDYMAAGVGEVPEGREYVKPLTSLVFYGTQGDESSGFSFFVGIE